MSELIDCSRVKFIWDTTQDPCDSLVSRLRHDFFECQIPVFSPFWDLGLLTPVTLYYPVTWPYRVPRYPRSLLSWVIGLHPKISVVRMMSDPGQGRVVRDNVVDKCGKRGRYGYWTSESKRGPIKYVSTGTTYLIHFCSEPLVIYLREGPLPSLFQSIPPRTRPRTLVIFKWVPHQFPSTYRKPIFSFVHVPYHSSSYIDLVIYSYPLKHSQLRPPSSFQWLP